MGTHRAFTRAGAMGRRESALMVLKAFLRSVVLFYRGAMRCLICLYLSVMSRAKPGSGGAFVAFRVGATGGDSADRKSP